MRVRVLAQKSEEATASFASFLATPLEREREERSRKVPFKLIEITLLMYSPFVYMLQKKSVLITKTSAITFRPQMSFYRITLHCLRWNPTSRRTSRSLSFQGPSLMQHGQWPWGCRMPLSE